MPIKNRVDSKIADRRLSERVVVGIALILACVLSAAVGFAQPPGTYPPPDLVRPPAAAEPGKLPISGYLFLDDSKNRVLMPRMSYERLMELELGSTNQPRRHIIDSVNINGRVEGDRAELTVEVKVQVDATGDEPVEIPLAMENFHRIGPTEFFQGAENGNDLAITVDEVSGGHQLIASSREETVVGVRMQMSARVETDSVQSLEFRLPPAPIVIDLTSDSSDVQGVIPDRDDEVIETTVEDSTGRSRFVIESSGGRFLLQWGKLDRPVSTPLLDVTSGISMLWNSPQDPLIQNVRMTLRDSRGPISNFKLRLPAGATIRDEPKLITSGQFGQTVELSQPSPDDDQLLLVTIPRGERRQSVAIEFRIEIPSDSPSSASPLDFRVPVVEDALRNQGTISITAGTDYRLRWRQRPYVKNTSSATVEDATVDQREYSFQFIRGGFTLPLWLDATQRELRVTSECEVELRDRYADLTMQIRSVGNGNRAQMLSVDLADWQSPRIENARTGVPLSWYESDGQFQIEVNYTGMEEISPVLIRARRPVEVDPQSDQPVALRLPIPRVLGSGDRNDPVLIQEATVSLTGKGRRKLVVDLEQSTNVERSSSGDSDTNEPTRGFVVVPPASPAEIVGALVVQPPRLILQDNRSTIRLVGNQLDAELIWNVLSKTDLEGQLRVAIPDSAGAAGPTTAPWSVSVNGSPGQLRAIERTEETAAAEPAAATPDTRDDASDSGEGLETELKYFELISDELGAGEMEIRFHRVTAIRFDEETSDARSEIGFPSPVVQDVTLEGAFLVDLIGNESFDVTPFEPTVTGRLEFRNLPSEPIPLRISPRTRTKSELEIGSVLIRSAINEVSQHDQLLAAVSGSGQLSLSLNTRTQADIEILLDGERAAFKTIDNQLLIAVPRGNETHQLDVRIWVDRSEQRLFQSIEPVVYVGPVADRLFWQLSVPYDTHLIWASPSVGRAMQWGFDRWRMKRQPMLNETALASRVFSQNPDAAELSPMPGGNRYLFSAMDDRSFRVATSSRTVLWLLIAGTIVLATALLTYLPSLRNPLSVIVALVAFSGLLAVAPDASILVGQVAMLAMVLVVVMLAIRSIVLPAPSRVLSSSRESRGEISSGSARQAIEYRPPSSIAVTHSVGPEDVTSTRDEVAP